MLRSLNIRDGEGRLIKGARQGQPKTEKEMSEGEKKYVEEATKADRDAKFLEAVEVEVMTGNNSRSGIAKALNAPEENVKDALGKLAARNASAVNRGIAR